MTSGQLVFLLLIAAVFYVLIIGPQRRKMRQQQQMSGSLTPGAEVMTTAGLYATVVEIGDDDVRLEVAPGVVQRYAKAAVLRVVTPVEPEETDGPDETDGPADHTDEHHERDGSNGGSNGSTDGSAAPREP